MAIDLSKYKLDTTNLEKYKITPVDKPLSQQIWSKLPSPTIKDVKESFLYKGAEAVKERIMTGGERLAEETAPIGKLAELGTTLAGVTAETLKTAFAPIGMAVEKGIEKVSDIGAVQDIASNERVGKFLDSASNIMGTIFQNWEEFSKTNPRLAEGIADNAEILLTVMGEKPVQGMVGRVADTADDVAKRALKTAGELAQKGMTKAEDIIATFKSSFDDITKGTKNVSDVLTDTKRYFSRSNVPENLGSSVERLTTQTIKTPKGETVKYNPLQKYNEFYEQEIKFKADIKQDMAAGKVGERIGDAFDGVIKKRREVGETMSNEIKKIGNIRTPIEETFPKLETELFDNGLIYEKGKLIPTRTSKVTSQDIGLLEEYVAGLKELGANPTAAELDSFLSKIPKELDVFKSKNNITKVTNGERIVNNHLRELRSNLSPDKNPLFADYFKARSDYAELTKFLDEGSSFLGKKTQAGDYAKDASVAKSSVQSILNQGKKDWLIKLEDLTGYPALDEAVLALQAMKDAGNPMGHSLLELVTKGSIPLSPKGAFQKAIEVGLEYGKTKFVGSPSEQTKRIIQEMMEKAGGTNLQKGSFNPGAMFDDLTGKSKVAGVSDDLLAEAKKYKTKEEFIKAQQPEKVTFKSALQKKDYMGGHEAPMAEDINAPIWDLTGKYTGNELYPKDIYSSDATRLYSSGQTYDNQAISILHSLEGRPNKMITVYRAVSKDNPSEINPGDWVTLVRDYAKDHGESNLGGNYKIVKKTVAARDIFTDANSIQEFGYDPQVRVEPKDMPYSMIERSIKAQPDLSKNMNGGYIKRLTDIWNKANQLLKK